MIDRILKIVELKSNSKLDFSNKIGIEQTTFNNQMIGKRKVSLETIIAIISSFPDISSDWLITGKGSMLKSSDLNDSADLEPNTEDTYMQLSKALEIIAKQQETISLLIKEIGISQPSEENIENPAKKRKSS